MNYSNLIEEVEKFSNGKLKRKKDLDGIIKAARDNKQENLLENLSFNAKYVLGLQRALKKGGANPEIRNLEEIKKDFSDNLMKVIEQLKSLADFAPEEIKNHFNKTYLELSQPNLSNLNELLEDLEWLKMYLNNRKRRNN